MNTSLLSSNMPPGPLARPFHTNTNLFTLIFWRLGRVRGRTCDKRLELVFSTPSRSPCTHHGGHLDVYHQPSQEVVCGPNGN